MAKPHVVAAKRKDGIYVYCEIDGIRSIRCGICKKGQLVRGGKTGSFLIRKKCGVCKNKIEVLEDGTPIQTREAIIGKMKLIYYQ